ncbi:MAG TPA: M24 family metallopeptidase [Gaiellaceae bacterium]|nr:M24 family metallopeptidase [Gaiellaceae bacterium]
MTDVLVVGDTERVPELRHEVPLMIPDPFFYAERDGRRLVAVPSLEAPRLEALGAGLEVYPYEELGVDELLRAGLDPYTFRGELAKRVVRGLGIEQAAVPRAFPLGVADELRGIGVKLTVDQELFDARRRVKSEHELAGIRRAQRAAEAAMAEARDLLRRAEPQDGLLALDGEPLTCELVKERVRATLLRHGAFSDTPIVSHGAQTAVGHELGSGPIAASDVVLLDLFPQDLESACFADLTRTFVVGEAPAELRRAHDLCLEALELALGGIRAGVNGGDLHRRVCAFFGEHGYPTQLTKAEGEVLRDGFFHGLGHGVGLAVHEAPSLGLVGQELVAGDVVAIEPGLYRHGLGGVRVEDLVLVTDDGCEVLTEFPYDLEV